MLELRRTDAPNRGYMVMYRSNESIFSSLQQAYEAYAGKIGPDGYLLNVNEVEQCMRDRVEPLSLLVIGRDSQQYAVLIRKLK